MDDNQEREPAVFRKSTDAESTVTGGRAVIFHRGSGHAITLNETATLLWLALEQPREKSELVAIIQSQWPELQTATAMRDLDVLLTELKQHGLVEALN